MFPMSVFIAGGRNKALPGGAIPEQSARNTAKVEMKINY